MKSRTHCSESESSVSRLLFPKDSLLALFDGRWSLDPAWLPGLSDDGASAPVLYSEFESLSASLNLLFDRFVTSRENLLVRFESVLLRLPSLAASPSLRALSLRLVIPRSIDLRKLLCSGFDSAGFKEVVEESVVLFLLGVCLRSLPKRRSGEGDWVGLRSMNCALLAELNDEVEER